ncbi:hypothetical protein ACKI2N_009515 [Cupriavidus sp. 30B13]|uniref:hypothetical protein n=1 Tax=Cupriavidus sp. 30B13 TaxID=3384241 RepID=UPI003B8FF764
MSEKPNPAGYGQRDAAIRCQTYSPVRRRDGVPHELFALYWRDVHGPLCARLPGLGFYAQHHFSRERRANLWPLASGVRGLDIVLDGAVEIGFAGESEQARFLAASPILFGEEVHLFGWDNAYLLPRGSRTYVDRQPDATPNGPDRLHRLHVYLQGSGAAFPGWVPGFAAALADSPAVMKLRLHLPEPYDNANPQPPSPNVDHRVIDELLQPAIMEIGFESALAARAFFDSAAFKAAADGQATHVRSVAAFLVTGVYTYIRDGVLTTAGLRGSRTAEIIEQMGAVNQTEDDVASLFARQRRAGAGDHQGEPA